VILKAMLFLWVKKLLSVVLMQYQRQLQCIFQNLCWVIVAWDVTCILYLVMFIPKFKPGSNGTHEEEKDKALIIEDCNGANIFFC
jgi:hypothetical protein